MAQPENKGRWPPEEKPSVPKDSSPPIRLEWYAYEEALRLAEMGMPIPTEKDVYEDWKRYVGTFK